MSVDPTLLSMLNFIDELKAMLAQAQQMLKANDEKIKALEASSFSTASRTKPEDDSKPEKGGS
jgi:hypothetical protein